MAVLSVQPGAKECEREGQVEEDEVAVKYLRHALLTGCRNHCLQRVGADLLANVSFAKLLAPLRLLSVALHVSSVCLSQSAAAAPIYPLNEKVLLWKLSHH